MLEFNNFKIYRSDARNYRIEELRSVTSIDKVTKEESTVDKWCLLPDYYNNLEHALIVLVKGEFMGKLLEDEVCNIWEFIAITKEALGKLKIEIKKTDSNIEKAYEKGYNDGASAASTEILTKQ